MVQTIPELIASQACLFSIESNQKLQYHRITCIYVFLPHTCHLVPKPDAFMKCVLLCGVTLHFKKEIRFISLLLLSSNRCGIEWI